MRDKERAEQNLAQLDIPSTSLADAQKFGSETLSEKRRPRAVSFANYIHLDADKVINAFGKYGRYQMLAYVITSSIHYLYATTMMIMPFIHEDPEFSCRISPPNGVQWDYTEVDKCTILDNNNWTVPCLNIPNGEYLYKDAANSYAAEFNLVCENYEATEHGSSVFLLGAMLIAPIITQLSDIYGRKVTFVVPLYLSIVANLVCALAPNYTVFLVFRFFAGCCAASYATISGVLGIESVAAGFRDYMPVLSTIAWVLGYAMSGVWRLLIPTWRWRYFVAVVVPTLFTIPYYWLTPESLSWMITKQKHKGIKKYVRSAIRFNRSTIVLKKCTSSKCLEEEEQRTILDIFRYPPLCFSLFINSFLMAVATGVYWALSLVSTDLSEDRMTGFFLSALAELPGGIISTFVMKWTNRRVTSSAGFFLQGLVLVIAVTFCPRGSVSFMVCSLLAKMFNTFVWSAQPLMAAESAPTSVRNVFAGTVCFLGDVAGVVAPYLKRLESISINMPINIMIVLSFISTVVVWFLADTKNKELPDFDEFDGGPFFRKWQQRQREKKAQRKKTGSQIESALGIPIDIVIEKSSSRHDNSLSASDSSVSEANPLLPEEQEDLRPEVKAVETSKE